MPGWLAISCIIVSTTIFLRMSNEIPMQDTRASHSGAVSHRRLFGALAERMRPASGAVLTVSQTPPGALHAASGVAAQSLTHTPVHLISPAADLVHRLIALFAAVFAVCAIYAFLNPTAAEFARDYTIETARSAMSQAAAGVVGLRDATEGLFVPALLIGSADRPYPAAAAAAAGSHASEQPEAPKAPAGGAVATGTDMSLPRAVPSTSAIAVSVPFAGSAVSYGDIVSYDQKSSMYDLSTQKDDADVYGVVVETPPLVFKPVGRDGDISVVHTGPALVNVTMENGPIAVGDPVSVSSIPGKGRRAEKTDYVIGLAVEAFDGTSGVMLKNAAGSDVLSNTILVNVSAGAGIGADGGGAAAAAVCQSFLCRFFAAVEGDSVDLVVRYSLAAAVAAVSVWFAFKSFVSEANYGVISVGRNPRAKASIQSMVVFNAVLALVVAGAGIFASILIIIAAP